MALRSACKDRVCVYEEMDRANYKMKVNVCISNTVRSGIKREREKISTLQMTRKTEGKKRDSLGKKMGRKLDENLQMNKKTSFLGKAVWMGQDIYRWRLEGFNF